MASVVFDIVRAAPAKFSDSFEALFITQRYLLRESGKSGSCVLLILLAVELNRFDNGVKFVRDRDSTVGKGGAGYTTAA